MIKITVISPYEEFGELFKKIFQEHNEYIYKLDCGENEYELEVMVEYEHERIKRLKLDSDVVVARGYSAYLLRNLDYYIPVVEIPTAGNDLIRSLHESKMRFGNKEVIMIGSRNMIYDVESLSDIVGLSIKTHLLMEQSDKDIEDAFNVAVKDKNCIIVGGKKICCHADKMGLNNVMIKTGRASIWQAITEAKRAAYISRIEQEKALRFRTILNYTYEGIAAVDRKNRVSVINSACAKTFGVNEIDAIGKNINEIILNKKFKELLDNQEEYFGEIIKYNDTQIAVNKIPILLKGEKSGAVVTFQNATKIQEMEVKIRETIYSRGHVAKHCFDHIIGDSKVIKDAIQTAKRFSQVDSNILIVGKTGTGKELFAQSIHNYSSRRKRAFVAVNCAALPENLLESELFGYVEGAFTGAAKGGKPGLFELAHKGTIFLDEISEVSLNLQGRLLRVIQEKEIMRLGHDRIIPIDVRIVSATNRDIHALVKEGKFREDLYYRLDVLKIMLPSLDERKDDIPLIVEDYLKNYSYKLKNRQICITDDAKRILQEFEWPGNIRELINVCESLLVLNQSDIIDKDDVEFIRVQKNGERAPLDNPDEILKNYEKKRLQELLEKEGYSKSKVAQKLGINRTTLWRHMKKMGMI